MFVGVELLWISGDPQCSILFSLISDQYMKVKVIFLWLNPLRFELPHLSSAEGPLKNRVDGHITVWTVSLINKYMDIFNLILILLAVSHMKKKIIIPRKRYEH